MNIQVLLGIKAPPTHRARGQRLVTLGEFTWVFFQSDRIVIIGLGEHVYMTAVSNVFLSTEYLLKQLTDRLHHHRPVAAETGLPVAVLALPVGQTH